MNGKRIENLNDIISGTVMLLVWAITMYLYNRVRDWKFNKIENKNEWDNEAPQLARHCGWRRSEITSEYFRIHSVVAVVVILGVDLMIFERKFYQQKMFTHSKGRAEYFWVQEWHWRGVDRMKIKKNKNKNKRNNGNERGRTILPFGHSIDFIDCGNLIVMWATCRSPLMVVPVENRCHYKMTRFPDEAMHVLAFAYKLPRIADRRRVCRMIQPGAHLVSFPFAFL